MIVLLLGLGTVAAVVVSHIFCSRLLQPVNHALVVVRLSVGYAALSFAFLAWLGGRADAVFTFWQDFVRLGLFEAALLATYLGLFTAVEDDGPSMSILLLLSRAGKDGCSLRDCESAMHDDFLFQRRIEAMRRDGWITINGESCQLTWLGHWWANCFKSGHLLFGIPEPK